MHKIYSRNRIRLPRIIKTEKKYTNKIATIFFIIFIAIFSMLIILNYLSPIYEKICEDKAKSIATLVTNEQSTLVIKKYQYDDLFNITKDNDGNITMIETKVYPLNLITSDIAYNIQETFSNQDKTKVNVPLGSFSGIKFLAGSGPDIPIQVKLIGNVDTSLKSEFVQQGVNQTLHRVYLNVSCNVSILTAFDSIDKTITNEVLLIENVIVGQIPSSYYNIEGANGYSNALDIIN